MSTARIFKTTQPKTNSTAQPFLGVPFDELSPDSYAISYYNSYRQLDENEAFSFHHSGGSNIFYSADWYQKYQFNQEQIPHYQYDGSKLQVLCVSDNRVFYIDKNKQTHTMANFSFSFVDQAAFDDFNKILPEVAFFSAPSQFLRDGHFTCDIIVQNKEQFKNILHILFSSYPEIDMKDVVQRMGNPPNFMKTTEYRSLMKEIVEALGKEIQFDQSLQVTITDKTSVTENIISNENELIARMGMSK